MSWKVMMTFYDQLMRIFRTSVYIYSISICFAFLLVPCSKDLQGSLYVVWLWVLFKHQKHLQELAKNCWKTAWTNTNYMLYTAKTAYIPRCYWWCWILSAFGLGGEVDGGCYEPGMSHLREDFDDSIKSDQIYRMKSCQKQTTASEKKWTKQVSHHQKVACLDWM